MGTILDKPFNTAQVKLIQLLAQDLENQELMKLRKILITFRFKLVEERAQRIADSKGWSIDNVNQLSQDHLRTTYHAFSHSSNCERR